ncbi:hypothetical protein N9Z44_03960 [Mariniblastus sp.]|jgi:hypothetical protein|nr:hypothetical protein [Mariniblastus sp.]MDB4371236.1 hypothetical protein [Mariniblastus sp.]MDC3256323.1 hypothetical protein [bacterium]|eukprot:COSAG01_NODE_627_length_14711_cov_39.902614_9_plen_135_part_00
MGSANHPVRDVLKEIFDSSSINAEQVKVLEDFVRQDWVIDKTEVEQLLRVNHSLNQNDENCPEWSAFFVASISRLIIFDMNSPGEIDMEEGDWMASMLDKYSIGNNSEKQLLLEIQKLTSSIKGKLGDRIQPNE